MDRVEVGGPIEAVCTELFRAAYVVAYRILGDVTDAEDAAAEAIARACVNWRRVGGLAHRQAWVARVAANVALDAVRRRRPTDTTAPTPVADPAEAAVLRLALVGALEALSSRQRQVVVLRYLADCPETEVAHLLGVSVNTVKKHTLRGVAALRVRLGPSWEVVEDART